jgi:hypothetical protein
MGKKAKSMEKSKAHGKKGKITIGKAYGKKSKAYGSNNKKNRIKVQLPNLQNMYRNYF